MKVFLMYRDHDFDMQQEVLPYAQALIKDLELDTVFNAMALGDKFIFEVAEKAVLSCLIDPIAIQYRQRILKDCLTNSPIVRKIYDITVETIENRKKHHLGIFSNYPSAILHCSVELLSMLVKMIRELKAIANEHAGKFKSEGFAALFATLNRELDADYFASIQNHLNELRFRDGVLIGAELEKGNVGANYVLRKQLVKKRSLIARLFANKSRAYSFHIDNRDESGARALSELRDRGINLAANALAQSADHILSFFKTLKPELAFYIGCINLYEQLAQIDEPITFPLPAGQGERKHSFKGLYDVCLALTMKEKIVGNEVIADNKDLTVVTGANQGGKSTFLRSIGLAQLMMQCGMFVPAESFCANVSVGVFTHYRREEDAGMKSGKLDEELSRMSDIVDNIAPNSLLLFNESFAATNEREGSEIARQIIRALLEKRMKIFFVTHLYQCAHGFYDEKMKNAIFLRAERQTNGGRTFRLVEGEPLQTSFGEDLYNRIFGNGLTV